MGRLKAASVCEPTQDNIQVHLKAGRGPIVVLTCDIGDATGEMSSCFLPLEESRIKTMTLHTGDVDTGDGWA